MSRSGNHEALKRYSEHVNGIFIPANEALHTAVVAAMASMSGRGVELRDSDPTVRNVVLRGLSWDIAERLAARGFKIVPIVAETDDPGDPTDPNSCPDCGQPDGQHDETCMS